MPSRIFNFPTRRGDIYIYIYTYIHTQKFFPQPQPPLNEIPSLQKSIPSVAAIYTPRKDTLSALPSNITRARRSKYAHTYRVNPLARPLIDSLFQSISQGREGERERERLGNLRVRCTRNLIYSPSLCTAKDRSSIVLRFLFLR